ncbi:MAG: DUF1232 domain-containing protein [Saprospirales bacterium]|nr:MAG: DUF1232 domain-containing protein [Saprospirales bacterium]
MNTEELFKALKRGVKKSGIRLAYTILLLYNAFIRKETPHWAKTIITGAFAYLICPADAIPDVTPIVGYTDDLGVLSFGLVAVASYINNEVRGKARSQLKSFCPCYNEADLKAVEEQL